MKAKQIIKACVVAFSYYPADPRVRREAEALVESGMSVDVICLKDGGECKKEIVNGVEVHRLPIQRKRGGKLRYVWGYAYFVFLASFNLSILYVRKRYDVIHVHNMPDFLVFSALLPGITGCKIILDLHDPMPEVFMAKYSKKESHPAVGLLRLIERCSIGFASLVLTPNIAFRDLFISRSCPEWKIHVVMNSPQEKIFGEVKNKMNHRKPMNRDEFVIMYHGTIIERNGLDKALKALVHVREKIPNLVFCVYGNGNFVNHFLDRIDEFDLGEIVKYHGHVPLEMIAAAIYCTDVGLVPNEPSKHWDLAMPTRLFEYLSMGKPVIAPRTRGILDYFDEESIHFHEPGNVESLAEAILEVYSNPLRRQTVLNRAITVYHRYRWTLQRKHFIELVASLLE